MRDAYTFPDPRPGPRREITVHLYRPGNYRGDSPILVVMHGRGRNGADYRDFFVDESERLGFAVVAPEFPEAQYAHPHEYNYGAMWRPDGTFALRKQWLFPVIDAVFRDAVERLHSTRARYALFGHSAGAQVVHRFATFAWSPLIERAIAANAGSYTMPLRDEPFPFGLDCPVKVDVAALLSRPLLIQLGDLDNDPNHAQLPRDPGAMRQGRIASPAASITSRRGRPRPSGSACRSSGASPSCPASSTRGTTWRLSPRASSSARPRSREYA
jgi:poly(3-hydroxybutyrate) depolymerase